MRWILISHFALQSKGIKRQQSGTPTNAEVSTVCVCVRAPCMPADTPTKELLLMFAGFAAAAAAAASAAVDCN